MKLYAFVASKKLTTNQLK